MKITKKTLRLYASTKAVIVQFLYLSGNDRIRNVIKRIKNLTEPDVTICLEKVKKDFEGRHRNIEEIFLSHFKRVEEQYGKKFEYLIHTKQLLMGAFFTKEYSIQAAALFNPSMVPHPNQQGLNPGEQRFVMSLRATGEGHISSIIFQTGILDKNANIILDAPSGFFTCLRKKRNTLYSNFFLRKCATSIPTFNNKILNTFPDLQCKLKTLSTFLISSTL